MRTILVDDKPLELAQFETESRDIPDLQFVGKFDNAEDALEYAQDNPVEFALLDIEMPGMNGLDLGRKLKAINPEMILIYVTAHSRYVLDTLKIKADYCIMKPYDREDIMDAAMRARLLGKRMQPCLRVKTFGRFEIFRGERPIHFGNEKAKELLALCIDREGSEVKMEEVIDLLWPNRPYDDKVKRLYRKALSSIQRTLEEVGFFGVLQTRRGCCYIDKECISCDLYRFLEGGCTNRAAAAQLEKEGYMFEYPWAEERYARLLQRIHELR